MHKEVDLGKDSIVKLFIKYVIPSVVGMLAVSMNFVADGIFVGRGVGADGLAAVNIASPLINFGIGTSLMIAIGGGIISTFELGENRDKRASEIFSLTFAMLVVISLALTVIVLVFRNYIPYLLGASAGLGEYVKDYLVILSIGNVFFMGVILLDIGLRSMGRPNFSIIIMTLSAFMNIILNYFFILRFNWGISGAAFATSLAQLFAFTVLLVPFLKKDSKLKIVKPKLDMNIIKRILANGSSEFVTAISLGIQTLIFNIVLMKNLGENGVAAFSIILYIGAVVWAITIGIAQAMQPIVSFNYGARKNERLVKTLKMSLSLALGLGIVTALGMLFYARPLVSLFAKSDSVILIDMTVNAAKIYSFAFLVSGVNIIASNYFSAIENAKSSALISLLRGLILIVVGILILPSFFGVNGIWLTVPFAEIITLVVAGGLLYKSNRQLLYT